MGRLVVVGGALLSLVVGGALLSLVVGCSPPKQRCAEEYLVGDDRICARLRDGSYRCRGRNTLKQSTHGNWPGLPPPTSHLQAFPGPWEHLTIGAQRTCGARHGRLWCWGDNAQGHFREFNNGVSAPKILAEPMLAEGFPPGIVGIDIGGLHVCTLDKAGQVTCKLGFQQLLSYPNLPKNVEEIAAGSSTVCVRTRQEVWCHGGEPWALEGGDRSSTAWVFSPKPLNLVKVEGIPGPLKTLSQRCVLNEAGEVWCWATNNGGQWGDGTAPRNCDAGCPGLNLRTGHRAKLPNARQIASSGGQVCAITGEAEVWCWGDSMANEFIELARPQPLPAKIELLGNDNLRVYAGAHWCVEKLDHRLYCWGSNDYLQIADQRCIPGRTDCPLTEVKFSCEG